MDRRLARKNLRTAFIVCAIMLFMFAHDLGGGAGLHPVSTEPEDTTLAAAGRRADPSAGAEPAAAAQRGRDLDRDHRHPDLADPRDPGPGAVPRHRRVWIAKTRREMDELPLDHSAGALSRRAPHERERGGLRHVAGRAVVGPAAHDVADGEDPGDLPRVDDDEWRKPPLTIAAAACSSDHDGLANTRSAVRCSATFSASGSWPPAIDSRTSRSVMIPGPSRRGRGRPPPRRAARPSPRRPAERVPRSDGQDHRAHSLPDLHRDDPFRFACDDRHKSTHPRRRCAGSPDERARSGRAPGRQDETGRSRTGNPVPGGGAYPLTCRPNALPPSRCARASTRTPPRSWPTSTRRSLARRHRPPRRLLPPPAAAGVLRGREHDVPRPADPRAHGPRRRAARPIAG